MTVISKTFRIAVGGLVVAIALGGLGLLHLERVRLQRSLERQRQQGVVAGPLQAENRQLRKVLERAREAKVAEPAAVHADLVAARVEAAELARRAQERRAQALAVTTRDAAALDANRDPRVGLMRLEHFQDVGQATPDAACQTIVWAVMKNEPGRLAELFSISPAARARAEELIASLPPDARAQWSPEKLGALFINSVLLEAPALQIADVRMDGSDRAVVMLRIPGESDPKMPMELGPSGWRAVLPAKTFDAIRKKMSQALGMPPK